LNPLRLSPRRTNDVVRAIVLVLLVHVAGTVTIRAHAQDVPSASPGVEASGIVPAPPEPPVMNRAPRLYELSLSATATTRISLPLSDTREVRPFGIGGGLRMGWRVGGYRGGPPAWVGFDMQLVAQPTYQGRNSLVLGYGIFAKHGFLPNARVRPFVEYGLGAAQVWVRGIDGREIGHRTRLGFGIDIPMHGASSLSIRLAYVLIVMPTLGSSGSSGRKDGVDQIALDVAFAFESPGPR